MSLPCWCGHAESLHTGAWGPNSIGQHGFGLCTQGWDKVHGYLFQRSDSCRCGRYKGSLWRALRARG